jgi:RNA recognition motif-containing protein
LGVFDRIRQIILVCFRPLFFHLFQLVSAQSVKDNLEKGITTVTNIFVGNLSYRTTQDELHTAFAQYGGVERVNIVTDRDTGQSRGFAFVEMRDAGEAQAAITHLNGTELNGRVLNVNEARPKPAGEGGGGFGGRREGRGGGGGSRGGRGGGSSGGAQRW